jgi:rhodanese-related sulfurtransferase
MIMDAFGVLSVEEVKSRCESGEKVRLIDVREPSEYRIGHLERSELRPLGLIRQWMESLPDRDEEIILYQFAKVPLRLRGR